MEKTLGMATVQYEWWRYSGSGGNTVGVVRVQQESWEYSGYLMMDIATAQNHGTVPERTSGPSANFSNHLFLHFVNNNKN